MKIPFTINSEFNRSVASLVGSIVGAGIFGVPYALVYGGVYSTLFWFVVVTIFLTLTCLLLGEVCLRAPDSIGFVGVVNKYLSPKVTKFFTIVIMLNFLGACLAYTLLGAKFLQVALNPILTISIPILIVLYTLIVYLVSRNGMKHISQVELWLTGILLALLTLLSVHLLQNGDYALSDLVIENPHRFLGYGIFLFAMSGLSGIPPIEKNLGESKYLLKKVILYAMGISAFITILFGVAVASFVGTSISPETLPSLLGRLPDVLIIILALAGILAVFTSHIIVIAQLTSIFQNDFKFSPRFTTLATYAPALLITLGGLVGFIALIEFLGGFLGGIIGIVVGMLVLAVHKVTTRKPEYCIKNDTKLAWLIIVAYSAGIIYELFTKLF